MKRLFNLRFKRENNPNKALDEDLRWLDDNHLDSLEELPEELIDHSLHEFKKTFRRLRRLERRRQFIQVAASLLLVLSLGVYGVIYYTSNQDKIQDEFFLPAKGIATLEFDDGEVLTFDAPNIHENLIYNGISIINDSIRGLVFNQGEAKGIKNLQDIKYHTLKTPKGGVVTLTLEDGTIINVNAESKVIFPETFIGASERKVWIEGEAFLQVSKNKEKLFVVHMEGKEIEVLGTEFNVNGYNKNTIYTTLREGRVSMKDEFGASVVLSPGEQGVSHGDRLSKKSVDLNMELDWKNGDFYFDQSPLEEVMTKLSRWYNIDFSIQESKKNVRLNGVISRKRSLKEVLSILEKTGNFKHTIKERRIIIE